MLSGICRAPEERFDLLTTKFEFKKVIYCNECDVEFTLSFGMNHEAYKPKDCVFCSYTITEDDEDEVMNCTMKILKRMNISESAISES
jgi:hypothetical protein